jgi:hypothetical protein
MGLGRTDVEVNAKFGLVGNLGNDEIPHFALSPDENTFAFVRGKYFHDAVLIEGLK